MAQRVNKMSGERRSRYGRRLDPDAALGRFDPSVAAEFERCKQLASRRPRETSYLLQSDHKRRKKGRAIICKGGEGYDASSLMSAVDDDALEKEKISLYFSRSFADFVVEARRSEMTDFEKEASNFRDGASWAVNGDSFTCTFGYESWVFEQDPFARKNCAVVPVITTPDGGSYPIYALKVDVDKNIAMVSFRWFYAKNDLKRTDFDKNDLAMGSTIESTPLEYVRDAAFVAIYPDDLKDEILKNHCFVWKHRALFDESKVTAPLTFGYHLTQDNTHQEEEEEEEEDTTPPPPPSPDDFDVDERDQLPPLTRPVYSPPCPGELDIPSWPSSSTVDR